MQIEIWSDVMCPFCYIGKRKFEQALGWFSEKDKIQLIWKSFQLSPELITQADKHIDQYLAEHKGIPIEEARQMNAYVTQLARQVGLVYNFDRSVVANSFNAHRLVHFAKTAGKQTEAEEALFRAYFTDGRNIDDYPTLIELGAGIGLDAGKLESALATDQYADDVRSDIAEAQRLGIRGVPFFVFDRKYAVSGAQDSALFSRALEQSYAGWVGSGTQREETKQS